ncbi:helix-turn-helix transcriptional regulator [Serratia liquefaciens]|uniref:helix-turn-helix domain-containing protein n=1 Tax=Serratia liquefaciens TaxID=614 RepID=UPI0037FE3FC0
MCSHFNCLSEDSDFILIPLKDKREYHEELRTERLFEVGNLYRNDGIEILIEKLLILFSKERHVMLDHLSCLCGERRLTIQESRVMSLFGRGFSAAQVAKVLAINPKTVSAHKRTVMRKLGLRRTFDLFHWLRHSGLLNLEGKQPC